jgi:hypothetical protein
LSPSRASQSVRSSFVAELNGIGGGPRVRVVVVEGFFRRPFRAPVNHRTLPLAHWDASFLPRREMG